MVACSKAAAEFLTPSPGACGASSPVVSPTMSSSSWMRRRWGGTLDLGFDDPPGTLTFFGDFDHAPKLSRAISARCPRPTRRSCSVAHGKYWRHPVIGFSSCRVP
eukprot:scaffold10907_cov119-Isochrysis_galbana.AAC.1